MSSNDGEQIDLDTAVPDVYVGPLDGFVRRRDALAKALRAAGRKDDASAVKALRKPSRMAWALGRAALQSAGSLDVLDAAVDATLEAQASGGDVRSAINGLRSAVRGFASEAARAAAESGQRLDDSDLSNAVLAVLGNADAMNALHRGCLVDVPEAGGLDFLASLPVPPVVTRLVERKPSERPVAPSGKESPERPTGPSPSQIAELRAAAQAALQEAERSAADAKERAEAARRALSETEARLTAADERLRQTEIELRLARGERDLARRKAEEAAAARTDAEQALARARSRLAEIEDEKPDPV